MTCLVSIQGVVQCCDPGSPPPVVPKRGVLKISFECSILYRLLSLMGAPFLRSSRCRKATGLPIQLTRRNPSGCPLPSLPKRFGRKEPPWNYLQSCKENRLLVCCRESSSDLQQQRSSASPGAGGHWGKLPGIWQTRVPLPRSSSRLLPFVSTNSDTMWMRKRT